MKKFSLILVLLTGIVSSCSAAPPVSGEIRDISVADAAELVKSNDSVVVLDIRTPGEFQQGHIKGAKHIDFLAEGFDEKIAKLDKNTTYLMHCASGGRSGKALANFKSRGFTSILHLKDGFMGWKAAGLPVTK